MVYLYFYFFNFLFTVFVFVFLFNLFFYFFYFFLKILFFFSKISKISFYDQDLEHIHCASAMLPACEMLTLISVTPNISLTFLACPHSLTKGAPVVRITSISFKGAEASIHKFCAPVKKM